MTILQQALDFLPGVTATQGAVAILSFMIFSLGFVAACCRSTNFILVLILAILLMIWNGLGQLLIHGM